MTLRGTLSLALAWIGIYVVAIVVIVSVEISRTARPRPSTDSATDVYAHLHHRTRQLDEWSRLSHEILRPGGPASDEQVARFRQSLRNAARRTQDRPFSDVPPGMRRPLALADLEMARVEGLFVEVLAHIELGRADEARQRANLADSLAYGVRRRMEQAQLAGVADIEARGRALDEMGRQVRVSVTAWALGWMILVPLLVLLANSRLRAPLEALEGGLNRVAGGDLTASVPVHRRDEIGRLIEHFNDMTRVLRGRAEQQGRLAAAGELVAGVAHEVNNPLMAISAIAEGGLEDDALDPRIRADLQQVLRQARRAGTLIQGLLKFVRQSDPVIEPVDLNGLALQAVELVSYQFAVDEIEFERRLDAALPTALADGPRIEQVLVNLLSNAIHALRAAPRPRRITIRSWYESGQCHMAVVDNGPGIAPHDAERVFLPFVTTKKCGGTGLGLYISRQLARDLNGRLVLERNPGGGATFVLSLPAAADARTAAEPSHTTGTEANGNSGEPTGSPSQPLADLQILVVDDESTVRRPLVAFLRRRGAQVVEAADGLAALTTLERFAADVILTDLRMPRMDGVELYRELLRDRPDLAAVVVILSGDLHQLETSSGLVIPRERILAKPIQLRSLEERVIAVARDRSRGEAA